MLLSLLVLNFLPQYYKIEILTLLVILFFFIHQQKKKAAHLLAKLQRAFLKEKKIRMENYSELLQVATK